jgi:AcrR family transcriptional regulator
MDVGPRKSPRQTRARVTVDAIVEATAQVLLEKGYDRFTTARAAERAGVSIGSLYQYFPNKAALACAVIDRCCANFVRAFQSAVTGRSRVTLADCVEAMIDVTLVSHHLSPELHKMVNDLAPRLGIADRTAMVSRTAASTIESILRGHTDEIASDIDLAAAATLIEALLETLAHRSLSSSSGSPDSTLANEAARMVTRYLAIRGRSRRPPDANS